MDESVFVDTQTMAAALKLHAVLDVACRRAGDDGLSAHALLTGVAERADGFPLREVRRRFEPLGDVDRLVGSLEEREFVGRVRGARDRREFALRATRKGIAQIERIDEVLAHELIARAKGLSEGSFEQLVGRLSALSAAVDEGARIASLFPSVFLLALDAYRRSVVQEAARLGLTSFQAAVLASLDVFDDEGASLAFVRQLGLAEETVDVQIERLREKGLVAGDGGFALLAEGITRLDALGGRMRRHVDALLASAGEGAAERARDVSEFLVYVLL